VNRMYHPSPYEDCPVCDGCGLDPDDCTCTVSSEGWTGRMPDILVSPEGVEYRTMRGREQRPDIIVTTKRGQEVPLRRIGRREREARAKGRN